MNLKIHSLAREVIKKIIVKEWENDERIPQ